MPRRPADPERTRSVLLFCGAVAFVLAVVVVASALWEPLGRVLFSEASSGAAGTTVPALFVALVLAAVGIACVRLAGDDGSGVWCAECVARNPEDATSCRQCGALLG